MDINQFLLENATAVMGLIGVIAGAVLTSIPIILLQLLQRRWQIQDERRQWRRDRLLSKLSIAQDWLDDVLRFTDAFEKWLSDDNDLTTAELLEAAENDLGERAKDYEKNEAIMFSRVMSTGDEDLIKLIINFRAGRTFFLESLKTNDEKKISVAGFALQATAAQIARRIEYLIEKASPLGESRRKQSFLQLFRRKPKMEKKEQSEPPA